MSKNEGELKKRIREKAEIMTATLIDDVEGTSEEVPIGIRGIEEILDAAKQEFEEVLKHGETRLDELPRLIRKWFGGAEK